MRKAEIWILRAGAGGARKTWWWPPYFDQKSECANRLLKLQTDELTRLISYFPKTDGLRNYALPKPMSINNVRKERGGLWQ